MIDADNPQGLYYYRPRTPFTERNTLRVVLEIDAELKKYGLRLTGVKQEYVKFKEGVMKIMVFQTAPLKEIADA